MQHSITNQQQSIPLADHFSEKVLTEKNQKTEKDEEAKDEAETEMLLSALFPQLFSPLPINDPRSSSQQNSPLFSDGSLVNNSEVEGDYFLFCDYLVISDGSRISSQNRGVRRNGGGRGLWLAIFLSIFKIQFKKIFCSNSS